MFDIAELPVMCGIIPIPGPIPMPIPGPCMPMWPEYID